MVEVRRYCLNTDKINHFCRTYADCAHIYMFLRNCLERGVNPICASDLSQFRLVDIFTACTHPQVNETTLKSFCDQSGKLRVIVATVVFGMSLDCPNVISIVHW